MPHKQQAVLVDSDTALALKDMAVRMKLSPSEIVKAGATILSYAMGRKIKIEDNKKVVEIDSLEKYNQIIDLGNERSNK